MLILKDGFWSAAMGITYEEIRTRRKEIEAEKVKRMNLVLVESQTLVDSYKKSLGLKDEIWTDIKGIKTPYVSTGFLYDNTYFRKVELHGIPITEKYEINFIISTVTDDSPRGGSTALVDITLRIKDTNGTVHVEVGKSHREFDVKNEENKYDRVCEEIKLQVLSSMDDPNLKLEEYFDYPEIPS